MNEQNAEYYLHENGSLICKPNGGVQHDSAFVKGVWNAYEIGSSPQKFVDWLKHVFELGANVSEIERLANNNNLNLYFSGWSHYVFGRFDVAGGECIHGVSTDKECKNCQAGEPF
ncbi:hypothetical protein ABKY54_004147 [Vibrio harveyi]